MNKEEEEENKFSLSNIMYKKQSKVFQEHKSKNKSNNWDKWNKSNRPSMIQQTITDEIYEEQKLTKLQKLKDKFLYDQVNKQIEKIKKQSDISQLDLLKSLNHKSKIILKNKEYSENQQPSTLKMISQLKLLGKQYQQNKNESEFCLICLFEFEENEMTIELPCMHTYHISCLCKWLNKREDCMECNFNIIKYILSQ